MDLLDTILRAAGAHVHLEKFKEEHIDARSLKALSDKDLEMIGIAEEETRNRIISHAQRLMIKSETHTDIFVDLEYSNLVLLHVSNQLKLHNANLYCATHRPDIINCDIKLEEGVDSILKGIKSFKSDLVSLKQQVEKTLPRRKFSNKKKVIIPLVVSIVVCVNVIIIQKLVR